MAGGTRRCFALTIQCIGSVNASSLAFSLFAALLWLPFAVWITHEVRLRQALATLLRLGLLTLVTSLWWMSGLWAQSRYGIDVLRYSETARTVATASTATEVLRGLGYWYFYGTDKLTPIVDAAQWYTEAIWLLALSFLIPTLSLLSGAFVRFRERAYFVALILFGMILAVGAYPWTNPAPMGGLIKWFLSSSQAGSAMRSLPRAAPLVVLGMATLLGGAVTAVHERVRLAGIPRPVRFVQGLDRRVFAASGLLVILIVANQPALFTGWFITNGISRPSAIPNYWEKDAAALDSGDHNSRIWEIPGSNFASYRWDGKLVSSVDPITPGLTSRPFVAREQVPYGTLPTANLLAAFDDQLQQNILSPDAIAPISRFMSVGDLNVRSDLAWERYGTVRPNEVWNILSQAGGLGLPQVFGGRSPQETGKKFPMLDEATLGMGKVPDVPKLAIVPVDDSPSIVKTAPVTSPVLLDGDGSGLVNTSSAGLLSGRELVLYSASMADDPKLLRKNQGKGAVLVMTDSNRKRATRWGTIQDMFGETELAGQKPIVDDPSDQRIDMFDNAGGDAARTVAVQRGGVTAVASSYGNPVTYTPDVRALYAVDGNDKTSWATAAFGPTHGERLELTYDKPLHTDQVTLLQPTGGHPNRWITKVELKLDNGFSQTLTLDKSSRKAPGQTFTIPAQTFSKATLVIVGDTVGRQYTYGSASSVGFATVSFGPTTPTVGEFIQLPSDLLSALGRSSIANPLAIVLTRDRINKYNSLRTDPEPAIARTWELPNARSFGITGTARLAPGAAPKTIDKLLEIPTPRTVASTSPRRVTSPAHRTSGDVGDRRRPRHVVDDRLPELARQPRPVQDREAGHVRPPRPGGGRRRAPFDSHRARRAGRRQDRPGRRAQGVHRQEGRLGHQGSGSAAQEDDGNHDPLHDPRSEAGPHQRLVLEQPDPVPDLDRGVGRTRPRRQGPLAEDAALVEVPRRHPGGERQAGARVDQRHRRRGTVGPGPHGSHLRERCSEAAHPSRRHAEPAQRAGRLHRLQHRPARAAFGGGRCSRHRKRTVGAHQGNGRSEGHGDQGGQDQDRPHRHRSRQGLLVGARPVPERRMAGHGRWEEGRGQHARRRLRERLAARPERVRNRARHPHLDAAARGVDRDRSLGAGRPRLPRAHPAPHAAPSARSARRGRGAAPIGAGDGERAARVRVERALRYNGAAPKLGTALLVSVGAAIAGGAIIGYWAGPIVGLATLLCMRFRRARPILTIGAPACLAIAGLYYVTFVALRNTFLRFGWPSWFTRVAPLGWFAVLFLALDVIVDRSWLRRWWPSAESEL